METADRGTARQDASDRDPTSVPAIDLTDADVVRDPFTAYGRLRERGPLARTSIPGIGPAWLVTRHEEARAMLADPRFAVYSANLLQAAVPEDCAPYMRSLSQLDGEAHKRLRRLMAPAFTMRRAAEFRPRIERIVDSLLDELPTDETVDLLTQLARPLPAEVVCEVVGVPDTDRERWRRYGAAVATRHGQPFADAVPRIIADARAIVARRREEPGDDLTSHLIGARDEDGDRLSDTEIVTLILLLMIAGQTPSNLIANAVLALLCHPDQLAALRSERARMAAAVEELIRWCVPILLTMPRYAREDVELCGAPVRTGDPVLASVAAVNRDPRVYTHPDRLDLGRDTQGVRHLGFAHGAHVCIGSPLARIQTEVALTVLLRRFPELALAAPAAGLRMRDPGLWRLSALPVRLAPHRSYA